MVRNLIIFGVNAIIPSTIITPRITGPVAAALNKFGRTKPPNITVNDATNKILLIVLFISLLFYKSNLLCDKHN